MEVSAKLTIQEKKKSIKKLFKGYKKMNRDFEQRLEDFGFKIEYTKKHIKLFYENKLFICPSTASDFRSGMNLATIICQEI